jgi:hypothetical protein
MTSTSRQTLKTNKKIAENDIVMDTETGELSIVVGMSWDHMKVGGWLRVRSATGIHERGTERYDRIDIVGTKQ